jgi:hypothetical protein
MRILDFGRYKEITSAKFRVKKVEESIDETCYYVLLSINGERINGEIFCDSKGDLECYQFYNSEGRCISEVYGSGIVEDLVKKKLRKLRK